MEARQPGRDVLLCRADEARMVPEVNEACPGSQDPPCLGERAGEVVEIRVRERRVRRVERPVWERQRGRVGALEIDGRITLPCHPQLIGRGVDADEAPSEVEGHPEEVPAAAAQIEASAPPGAEHSPQRIRRDPVVARARVDEDVVRICEPVVLRAAHASDASLGAPGCPDRG
jgi:hypothetical protein